MIHSVSFPSVLQLINSEKVPNTFIQLHQQTEIVILLPQIDNHYQRVSLKNASCVERAFHCRNRNKITNYRFVHTCRRPEQSFVSLSYFLFRVILKIDSKFLFLLEWLVDKTIGAPSSKS